MKFRLRWFRCCVCNLEFEDLVEAEEDTENIKCPHCNCETREVRLTMPRHGRHGSWGQWRMDQDWDKPGK
jgi:DNA-directed RNA polymerase subunit RPC12/RpoP